MKSAFVSTLAMAAVAGLGAAGPVAAKASNSNMEGSCVLGYATADTDHSGTLSRAEIRQMADTVFNDADADKSGDVTKQEFVDCRNMGAGTKSASTDRSPQNMKTADTDKSGDLSRREYMKAADAAGAAAREDQSPQAVRVVRRYIFVPAMTAADPAQMSRDETAARARIGFEALDTNGDGVLSKDEWSAGTATMPDRSAQFEQRFGALDADKSGKLKAEEFEAGALSAAADALNRGGLEEAVDRSQDTSATMKMSGEQAAMVSNETAASQSEEGDTAKAELANEPSVILFRFYPVF